MLSAEDLALRANAIGSSEVAGLLGIGPYGSPFEVFARLVLGVQKTATLPMRKGNALEGLIAELYAERTGHALVESRTMLHPRAPWICTSLDREVPGSHAVEIKAPTWRTAERWGPDGSDVFPVEYLVQVQLQMDAKGYERAELVALIEGDESIRVYPIAHDPELAGLLCARAHRFWRDHVLTGDPPAVDGSDAAARYIEERYPRSNGRTIAPDADALLLAADLRETKARIKADSARAKELTNQLKARCADADGIDGVCTYLLGKGEGRVAWKKVAQELRASRELLAKFRTPPGRTFRLLGAEDDEEEAA